MVEMLKPGEYLDWSTFCGTYLVRLQRTDAGQTWTVELRHCGMTMDRETVYDNEGDARRAARLAAETLRSLVQMEVAL